MKRNDKRLEVFKVASFSKEMVCCGSLGKFGTNWSAIQSKIIYLAGRYCDRWASDILVSLFSVNQKIEEGTQESESLLFGFREDGVDHAEWVIHKFADQHMYSNYYGAAYRQIWRLDIDVDEDERVTMTFYQVDKSVSEAKMKKAVETEANASNT